MASVTIVKASIKKVVTAYPLWTIGVTIDPARTEAEVGNSIGWRLFEADTEQVAESVEAYFVGQGMNGATGMPGFGAKYVFIFMGAPATPEGERSSGGLSSLKYMTRLDRYLADFKTMYGDRPDYNFLKRVYAEVITECGPDFVSDSELLATLYGRLESLGIEVAHLAYKGTNKTPALR